MPRTAPPHTQWKYQRPAHAHLAPLGSARPRWPPGRFRELRTPLRDPYAICVTHFALRTFALCASPSSPRPLEIPAPFCHPPAQSRRPLRRFLWAPPAIQHWPPPAPPPGPFVYKEGGFRWIIVLGAFLPLLCCVYFNYIIGISNQTIKDVCRHSQIIYTPLLYYLLYKQHTLDRHTPFYLTFLSFSHFSFILF